MSSDDKLNFNYRPIKSTDWPIISELFGQNGACGGCWCMHWRRPKGGKAWEEAKGAKNRAAFMRLVKNSKASGIIAMQGNLPVGWCSFGRRSDFLRLDNTKAYKLEDKDYPTDHDTVWCINCFYIPRRFRGNNLAFKMATEAIREIKKKGGKIIEAYPTPLTKDGKKLPAAFTYTGPESLFKKLNFKLYKRESYSRPLYRLTI